MIPFKDEAYARAKNRMEFFEDEFQELDKRYQQQEEILLLKGTTHVKETLRDATIDSLRTLTILNKLMIQLHLAEKEHPELQDWIYSVDEWETPELEDISQILARSMEKMTVLNSYVLDRLEISIDYTRLLYRIDRLNRPV